MPKLTTTLLLITLILAGAVPTFAQGARNRGPGQGQEQGQGQGQGQGPMQELRQQLNLTPDQVQQLRPILQDFRQKMNGFRDDWRQELKTCLTEKQQSRLKAILDRDGEMPSPSELAEDLNLSQSQMQELKAFRSDQKPQIRATVQGVFAQTKNVLTSEQQGKFRQFIQDRLGNRRGGQSSDDNN